MSRLLVMGLVMVYKRYFILYYDCCVVITTNLSPDLPVTESDSGIDSSVSHQTLTTSGRLSSLSHHSESTLNIIIPDGTSDEKTPKHERSPYQVRLINRYQDQ